MHDFKVGDVCLAQTWRTDEWPAVVIRLDTNTKGDAMPGAVCLQFIPCAPRDWWDQGDLVWSDSTVAAAHWKRIGHIDIAPGGTDG